MAAVTCVPAAPIGEKSACRIVVAGASSNDATAFDITKYPSEPQIKYYLEATVPAYANYTLRSVVFAASETGDFVWDNVIFPTSGTWTVNLRKVSDDSSDANVVLTVS